MCEWCQLAFGSRPGSGKSWLLFPTPYGSKAAYLPVLSQMTSKTEGQGPSRPVACQWDRGGVREACRLWGTRRITSEFVVGHLCEAHRDQVAGEEGPRGMEAWLRGLGILISTRFPPISPSCQCDFASRAAPSRTCTRTACSAEIIHAVHGLCERHFSAISKALDRLRTDPPTGSNFHGWWWD